MQTKSVTKRRFEVNAHISFKRWIRWQRMPYSHKWKNEFVTYVGTTRCYDGNKTKLMAVSVLVGCYHIYCCGCCRFKSLNPFSFFFCSFTQLTLHWVNIPQYSSDTLWWRTFVFFTRGDGKVNCRRCLRKHNKITQ